MIKLGQAQSLKINRIVEFGAYLESISDSVPEADTNDKKESVLLPIKQLPTSSKIGDILDVFVYRDSSDRLISTTNIPAISIGEVAVLRVKQLTKIGAFLDWGLEKDLFLPYKQQTYKVKEGDLIPVSLYIDKSDRLCATMKIYHYLKFDNGGYNLDDTVEGFIYEISDKFGAFVAIDYKYSALIPAKEIYSSLNVGELIKARVQGIMPDGRITLSLRQKSYLQIDTDSKKIYEMLEKKGFLPYHDKSDAKDIKEKFAMSKNEFKRALGRLYKERKIIIKEDGIYLV